MSLVLPVPGRVRVVVPPRCPWSEQAASLELPRAGVELVPAPEAWTPASVERLAGGRVDYLLMASADLSELPEGDLVTALRLLRDDPTTAAVGPSATGAGDGSLELTTAEGWLLLRAAALAPLARWVDFDASAGHLDLAVRLWATGHRVRTVGTAAGPQGIGTTPDAIASALRGIDADSPQADADMEALRRRHRAELAPLARGWLSRIGVDPTSVLSPDRATRIVVVTGDVIAPAMAGPAIRAVAIATALARVHQVRLLSIERCDLALPGLEVGYADESALRAAVDWADIVLFQGWVMAGRPWLAETNKILVTDLYDPMHLEALEQGRDAPGELGRLQTVRGATAALNEQMRRTDLALCASAEQRHLWLGALAALGRVNPVTYDDDPSLGALLELVPFGVPDEAFEAPKGAIKGVVPGIGPDDPVLLWGGGVYNWFDPLTLLDAVDRLRHRIPDLRLFFLGLVHPNPQIPEMSTATELRARADELGLTGRHVFFNEGWVDYHRRAAYLADADIGVSTHLRHVETEFSFRTRILDYLWAGLPVVATDGDGFAALLDEWDAGRTVPPRDVDALEAALAELLLDDDAAARCRDGSRRLAAELSWSRNLEPLIRFCSAPRRAPDVACPTLDLDPEGARLTRGWRRDIEAALAYLRAGGPREVARRIRARLARRRP